MKAFILAAGLGTRLRPLTDTIPKALVELNGKTLLQILIEKFLSAGIKEIVINVHHHSEKVKKYLERNEDFGAEIFLSDESEKLLDTGGAIKKAAPLLNSEPFILHNVDIVSDLDFNELVSFHKNRAADVTLVLRKTVSSRYFLFDEDMILCGWGNKNAGEEIVKRGKRETLAEYGFAGVHVIKPSVFKYFPDEDVFSIIDFYLNICSKTKICGNLPALKYWFDLGTIENLKTAGKVLSAY